MSCGTTGGYKKHRKNNETACAECKKAQAQYAAEWRSKHPEWKAKHKLYKDAWYRRNIESIRIQRANWYLNNAENERKIKKEYYAEKPEIARQSNRRRRARKLALGTDGHTEKQVLELYGTDCHICQKPINMEVSGKPGSNEHWRMGLHIDHLIPLVNGGSDTLDNVRPAHALCNLKKNKKEFTESYGD